jgi:biotin carboxylase
MTLAVTARRPEGAVVNGLMIAFAFALPYHVLRTARAAGVRVHVLGSGPSRGLRASLFCASYRTSQVRWDGEPDHEALLAEIREVARRHAIDVVFPSDDVSTRLLAAIRDRLPVRSTPLPDLATFDLLNDKSNFTRYALDHGVRVPQCWLYQRADEVRRDLLDGTLAFPVTVKPTNRSGSVGVIHIRDERDVPQLGDVDYAPILAQRHIVGETIGISVVCRDGKLLAHATQRRFERRFELFAEPDLVANVERLVAAVRLDGPANFDAVVDRQSGLAYIVECNPRFWYTIYLPMLLGLNFLAVALPGSGREAGPPATIAAAEASLALRTTLANPWKARPVDRAVAAYHLSDPLIYLLGCSKLVDDSAVAVQAARMEPYRPVPATAAMGPPPPAGGAFLASRSQPPQAVVPGGDFNVRAAAAFIHRQPQVALPTVASSGLWGQSMLKMDKHG